MKIAIAGLVCVLLSGCWFDRFVVAKHEPFDAECEPACFEKCDEKMLPITENPDSAIIAKKTEHVFRETCAFRKDACVSCLERAKKHGAITW